MAATQAAAAAAPPAADSNATSASPKSQHQRPPPNPSAVEIVKLTGGKPDANDNTAKLDAISKHIDKVQKELNQVRSLLAGAGPSKDSPAGIRRTQLRNELDELRNKQAGNKGSRGKVLDELRVLQDGIAKKVKDLQAAKSKTPYKTVADVDDRIARLEQQIDAGSMKLVEEKKALAEISQLKKNRRNVEALATMQASIDEDRAKVDQLKATLDDPESKALNKRYDEIKAELDEIQKEQEKAAGSRGKLLDQRTALSAQLDELYQQRRDRQAAFRAANDHFYQRLNAEREKRLEKQRAERQAAEEAKRQEIEQQMREDAALPAFAKEIEDCDVLINYFSSKAGVGAAKAEVAKADAAAAASATPVGGKALNIRQVNADDMVPKGAVLRKKEEESEAYFVGSGGKSKKNKKQNKRGTPLHLNGSDENGASNANGDGAASAGGANTGALHVPLGMLSALLSLSIPPPTNAGDVTRVVDNLKLKREYFVSNQARVTRQNIEKVEKLLAKTSVKDDGDATTTNDDDQAEKTADAVEA
ncbi:multicopy suppressor of BFA (Brefeldin A) [Thecaphora frezii]